VYHVVRCKRRTVEAVEHTIMRIDQCINTASISLAVVWILADSCMSYFILIAVMSRTTVEAMAAVMGGTQSLHTNSFDEVCYTLL
jgi:hypothetical protein